MQLKLLITKLVLLVSFPIILQGGIGEFNNKYQSTFSGTIYLLSIGIDDFGYYELNYAQSDADAFIKSTAKDSLCKKLEKYVFRNGTKKYQIESAIESIAKKATQYDLFIFYYSGVGMSDPGSILINETEKIDYNEIYDFSQHIFCERQLFILDASGGEVLVNEYKKLIRGKANDNRATNLNRIVISTETSYEGNFACTDSIYTGGRLTVALTKSPLSYISLFDLKSDKDLTRFKCNLYECSWDFPFELSFFSERQFIEDIYRPQTRAIRVESAGAVPPGTLTTIRKGETLCLILGNETFDYGWPGLANTINDARGIREVLQDKYRVKCIIMENAKYKDFHDTLQMIKSSYVFEQGSQLLLYCASHGNKDILDRGYLIFSDTNGKDDFEMSQSAYELQSLKRAISSFGATNTLMLVDICYSGTAFSGSDCNTPQPDKIVKSNPVYTQPFETGPVAFNFLNKETNLYFGASESEQQAADGEKGKNSPFGTAIISFLKENPLPVMDSYWLEQDIKEKIYEYGAFSKPVFCAFNCQPDGRFFFIQK